MSAVAMRPHTTFGSTEASTSYSSHAFNDNSSSGSGKRASARKRAERFLHEKAPGVSTLVAGHQEGILSSSSNDIAGKLGIPLKSAVRHGKNSKRYSRTESSGLIPDIEGGDQLHDPEYEAIKLVERPPPPLPTTTRQSSSTSNHHNISSKSSTTFYSNGINGTSSNTDNTTSNQLSNDDNDDDSSDATSIVSSTEDEEENGMEAFSPKNRALQLQAAPFGSNTLESRRHASSLHSKKQKSAGPSRSYRNYTTSSAGRNAHDTSASSIHRHAHTNADLAGVGASTTSAGRLGQNLRSYAATSGHGGSTNFLRPPSIQTHSTGRSSSRRTFADGPATYLAPSITMPPINAPLGQARAEGYNPYTYIPTTAAPSDVLSHHHSLPFSHPKRHVDFGPSTLYTYEKDKEQERIAPPIAWQSSFTPSADHPERHKTKIHDETPISTNLKRSIQSIKLDITFGLMKLGKKK